MLAVAKVLSTLLAYCRRSNARNDIDRSNSTKNDCDVSKCINDLTELLNRFSSPHRIVSYELDCNSKVILSPKNIALYLINKEGEVFELNKKREPLKSKGHILDFIKVLSRVIK